MRAGNIRNLLSPLFTHDCAGRIMQRGHDEKRGGICLLREAFQRSGKYAFRIHINRYDTPPREHGLVYHRVIGDGLREDHIAGPRGGEDGGKYRLLRTGADENIIRCRREMIMRKPCSGCLPVAQRAAGGWVAVEKRRPSFAPTLREKGGERRAHYFILPHGW